MKLSSHAENISAQINTKTKLGDLRKIATDIKKNNELATELWSTERFLPRQLAILIMDNKLLSQDMINKLDKDMQTHPVDERNQLMANQFTKEKRTITLIQSWENSPSPLQRRTYWYYQARLGPTWLTPPENTSDLLSTIETSISTEEPKVQWAMNFTTDWIGVYEKKYRNRCIALVKKTGLYKGEMTSKGYTPDYLTEFIAIGSNKRNL